MKLTIEIAAGNLLRILKQNAPVGKGVGPKGKPGTNMYSPFRGNLRANGIYFGYKTANKGAVVLSGVDGKVGYLPYTEARGKSAGWQEKSVNEFVSWLCSTYGGKRY